MAKSAKSAASGKAKAPGGQTKPSVEGAAGVSLVLVDGSSYLFRAFHALPPLTSSKGHPTGAIKGVIAMLKKLQDDHPEAVVAVVFDAPGKTFRNELYADYKGNRPRMDDDLRVQIQPIHDIVAALGMPLIIVPGVEADDVIGTLAREAAEAGRPVIISTGDKDLAQLVTPAVTLVNTMTETTMDEAGVEEKFGVPPDRIVDYLALVGDSVDNIPGVPKVGPKTAAKWLGEYDTLDGVIANADKIKGKVGDNLRGALDQLPLSRELTTIKQDLDLDFDATSLAYGEADNATLAALYTDFEFKAWVDELGAAALANQPPVTVEYETVVDAAALDQWRRRLAAADQVAVEVFTSGHRYMTSQIVGIAVSDQPHTAAYFPLAHFDQDANAAIGLDDVIAMLKPVLEDGGKPKVGHDLKYAMSVLARYDVDLAAVTVDTALASYVLDSVGSKHGFDELVLKFLGRTVTSYEEIAGKGAKRLSFDQVPVVQAADYAQRRVDAAGQLAAALREKLAATASLESVFDDIEMALLPVLSRVERHGAALDARVLKQQSAQITDELAELTARAFELADGPFNLDSPKQLQELLYDKLGLPVLRKTPKGQPSTAEPVLAELAHDYELPQTILDYRSLAKLKSTYTDKLPLEINPDTGRVHTTYQQAVAATGRLSSADPNLQNIPIRTEQGRRIRQAFVADAGNKLLAADYSQIELRIMAHLSADAGLIDAFEKGLDVHRATAGEVFGCGPDAVTDDQRRSAKAINFGLIYGMSAFGLGRQLGVPRRVAQEYIDRYFERYPGVRAYMDSTRERARDMGYVETLFGRRLYLPEIRVSNGARRQAAERTAINAPMQGTAADIIKRAMITVDQWLTESELRARMVMQVHDELVFEVAAEDLDTLSAGVEARMVNAADLDVALEVDVGVGDNWDEAH